MGRGGKQRGRGRREEESREGGREGREGERGGGWREEEDREGRRELKEEEGREGGGKGKQGEMEREEGGGR